MDHKTRNILEGCALRNRSSQKELYQRYYPYAMSISIRYINDQQLAEQAVNDSFMKVYKNIRKFNIEKAFKPWFRQILVNTSIDQLNKKKRFNMNSDLSAANELADREQILSSISYKELIGLVHSLSDAYRTIFNMYVIDGFKHEEIAKKLGISVGTSKSNLSKARTKLKAMIAEQLIVKQNG